MVAIKNKIGWTVIILLSVIPLFIWYTLMPFHLRWGSNYAIFTSLARMCSLTGMPLFAIALILSGRFRFLEDYFGGMNKVYVAHHLVGGIAFILLMIHPILLGVTQAMITWRSAAEFFLPSADWSLNFALLSLYSLMILLILTYFIKLRYHIWKFSHQFLGVSFFFGTLHVLMIESDVSSSQFIRWYLLALSALGLAVYFYRTLFGSKLVKRYTFVVLAVEQLNDDVWNIRMRCPSEMFSYLPGQFLFVSFYGLGISDEVHPFSISSSPGEPDVNITVKSAGDFTKNLVNLRPGNTARIEGPFGRFFSGKQKSQIWIAGGIGVTPFLSKARSLQNMQYTVDFYYIVRGHHEAVYFSDILTIASKEPNFRVCLYDTTVEKRITADTIKQISGDIGDRDIFICGPPPMMNSLRQQFIKLGVPNAHVHTEEFQFL